ncbi:hypothetical protein MHBO_000653 [Bonamia ostreae]|uniref:Uncharacterized protein n=1 Tax=Bonamia ostreae TaxID=126728 RepID=A0ABV2AGG3_9EUKA
MSLITIFLLMRPHLSQYGCDLTSFLIYSIDTFKEPVLSSNCTYALDIGELCVFALNHARNMRLANKIRLFPLQNVVDNNLFVQCNHNGELDPPFGMINYECGTLARKYGSGISEFDPVTDICGFDRKEILTVLDFSMLCLTAPGEVEMGSAGRIYSREERWPVFYNESVFLCPGGMLDSTTGKNYVKIKCVGNEWKPEGNCTFQNEDTIKKQYKPSEHLKVIGLLSISVIILILSGIFYLIGTNYYLSTKDIAHLENE